MGHGLIKTQTANQLLQPENDLETELLKTPAFIKGLYWGKPRFGHPEGEVLYHIKEVLDNIEKLSINPCIRTSLRHIAFVHDTFKYVEEKARQQQAELKHHGFLAREFMAAHINDENILTIIETHDDAFYAWRDIYIYDRPKRGQERLEKLLQQLGDSLQLYYLFFKCDTKTGDKVQVPIEWFEKTIKGINKVHF